MKTPPEILDKFEKATLDLEYGSVTLTLAVKQGRSRYVIAREESYIPTDEESVRFSGYSNEISKQHSMGYHG